MGLGRSFGVTQKAKIAVHSGVVALRMLARALLIESSPKPKPNHGKRLPKTAMPAKARSRPRVPGGAKACRRAARMIASVRVPASERRKTSAAGLMSAMASLMKRKLAPQMSASRISAA